MRKAWFSAAAAVAIAAAFLAAPACRQNDLSSAPRYGSWGFELKSGDASVKPGDDFYRFAEGLATDQMQIPADRSRYGTFDKLTALSEPHARGAGKGRGRRRRRERRQIGAYYKSFMDEAKVEALGAKPMAADLAADQRGQDPRRRRPPDGPATDRFGGILLRRRHHRRRQGPRTSTRSTSSQAAWACPTATTTWRPVRAEEGQVQAYVPRC